jgi:peroxiredoxin Q/BCP
MSHPMLQEGDAAPDFTLPATTGEISLSKLRGKPVILYFYPKDNTPGCTRESCEFNAALPDFSRLDAVIIGISKDSIRRHLNFARKYGLSFPLASDAEGDVCERYNAYGPKKLFGVPYTGVLRSTFLIGPDGKLAGIWRDVRVPGHVEEVAAALKTFLS